MASLTVRATLFVLYQLSIVFGIVLLPVGLVVRQAGVPFPIHRAVERLGDAYERAAA